VSFYGQELSTRNDDMLSISVSIEKPCYNFKEQIIIKVEIKNQSEKPIYLYKKKGEKYVKGFELGVKPVLIIPFRGDRQKSLIRKCMGGNFRDKRYQMNSLLVTHARSLLIDY